MRTIAAKLFTIEELRLKHPEGYEAALDFMRALIDDSDWYKQAEEQLIIALADIGFEVTDLFFDLEEKTVFMEGTYNPLHTKTHIPVPLMNSFQTFDDIYKKAKMVRPMGFQSIDGGAIELKLSGRNLSKVERNKMTAAFENIMEYILEFFDNAYNFLMSEEEIVASFNEAKSEFLKNGEPFDSSNIEQEIVTDPKLLN
jgi:hypothetical protein